MTTTCVYICAIAAIACWVGWALENPAIMFLSWAVFGLCCLCAVDSYRQPEKRKRTYDVHGGE